ncbi:hypothetical protein PDESU_03301 [Pontiella desulfatans]|uniref:Uncharacterized protein n=1 Tax=Pontiella desulfatans TaxID=2750659 RepID=A0A6C2U3X7_PONDE|nr:hypothetical protein [Pontiella desulfatans]VGO14732.1 hypothetical protein PDESU_03301 [Pontiella desulfatans]
MKTVYYNTTTGTLYDVDRGRELPRAQYPWIRYREKVDLTIICITGLDASGVPVVDTTLDASLAYEAAIDKDYSTTTTVMVKTLDANISITPSTGTIVVQLDANTEEFQAAVDTKKSISGTFELQGDDVDELVWSIDFPVVCKGTINAGSGDPDPIPAEDYYSKTETAALLASFKPTRVANFAALPASPTDLQPVRVTTLGYTIYWDESAAAWTTSDGAEVTAADES